VAWHIYKNGRVTRMIYGEYFDADQPGCDWRLAEVKRAALISGGRDAVPSS